MLNKHKCLFVSIIFYCLSIFIFMIAQLSIVGGTFMSGSIFSYNYSLRVAMNRFRSRAEQKETLEKLKKG